MVVPHDNLEVSLGEIDNGLKKYVGKVDPKLAVKILDAASWAVYGQNQTDQAFIDPTQDEEVLREYMKAINLSDVPGTTILDKSVAIAAAIERQEADDKDTVIKRSTESKAQDVAKELKEVKSFMEKSGMGDKDDSGPYTTTLVTALTPQQKRILSSLGRIEASSLFNFGKKDVSFVPGDDLMVYKRARLSDAASISVSDWVLPYTVQRIIKNQISVGKLTEYADKRQSVILLIDHSGSMKTPFKQSCVVAILMHIVEQLRTNDIQLWIGGYVKKIQGLVPILTYEEGLNYIKDYKCLGGGDTEIGEIIVRLQAKVSTGFLKKQECPPDTNIVLINDGQDKIHPVTLTCKVHAIMLGNGMESTNAIDLQNLAKKSGGDYITFKDA